MPVPVPLLLVALAGTVGLTSSAYAGPPRWAELPDGAVQRIAIGSCAYPHDRQPVWTAIRRAAPDLVVLLGDNVYADTTEPTVLAEALERLGRRRNLRRLARRTPFLTTWDDHDYGPNDADGRHPAKEAMRQVTLDFFGAASSDPRRTQQGGLYGAWSFGPPGQVLQVVLLDTRWGLSPRAIDPAGRGHSTPADGPPRPDGPYRPGEGQILDEAQWAWLEQALATPADLRIIGSSIPFATEATGWETWSNFPTEQARLTELLRDAGPVLVASGDVHYGELSRYQGIYDLTSSGLSTDPYRLLPNRYRVDDVAYSGDHYAMVAVDWSAHSVAMAWVDPQGQVVASHQLGFSTLDP